MGEEEKETKPGDDPSPKEADNPPAQKAAPAETIPNVTKVQQEQTVAPATTAESDDKTSQSALDKSSETTGGKPDTSNVTQASGQVGSTAVDKPPEDKQASVEKAVESPATAASATAPVETSSATKESAAVPTTALPKETAKRETIGTQTNDPPPKEAPSAASKSAASEDQLEKKPVEGTVDPTAAATSDSTPSAEQKSPEPDATIKGEAGPGTKPEDAPPVEKPSHKVAVTNDESEPMDIDEPTKSEDQPVQNATSHPVGPRTAPPEPPRVDSTKEEEQAPAASLPKNPVDTVSLPTAPAQMEIDDSPAPASGMEPKDPPVSKPEPVETLEEVFESFVPKGKQRKKKRKKGIKVSLATLVKATEESTVHVLPEESPRVMTTAERMLIAAEDAWGIPLLEDERADNDDALTFFEETHEEQDPAFVQYMQRKEKENLKTQLVDLEKRDHEGRKEIEILISRLSKEKRESTDKSHQLYRDKVSHEEQKEIALLQKAFQERSQMETEKIQKSLKYLQSKQQKEVNMALQHHNQMNIPEQMAQVEWQNTTMALQAKHQKSIQDFTRKSEEIRRRTSNEFKREQDKLKKKYAKKRSEVDNRRDKFVTQQMGQFAQLKQRYLKRHLQKIVAERESINAEMSDKKSESKSPKKTTLLDVEAATDKEQHRPASPVKSSPEWIKKWNCEVEDSILRHKHRKGILSQAVRQLSVEIHNEGIWSLHVHKAEEDGKSETTDQEFMQWGPRAFATLESIVCGEIPSSYEILKFNDAPGSLGGQLRCSITDLRTSKETASVNRAESVKELEARKVKALEKKTSDLLAIATETEKAMKNADVEERQASAEVEKASKIHDKAKQDLESFTNKFRSFLGPDGNPLPTASAKHRQDLMQTIMRYKSNVSLAGSKAAQAHKLVAEVKNKIQRLNMTLKVAQKNATTSSAALTQKRTELGLKVSAQAMRQFKASESPPFEYPESRVEDILSLLLIAAEKRREQLNQKKASAFSKIWAESYPELSDSMKKSLWHRMVRRKQQIVLRPTQESLVNELHAKIKDASGSTSTAEVENEILEAERIFLLACHPAPDEQLPSVPPTSHGQWAEPGWAVDLSVLKSPADSILPCAPGFPVLRKALCDFSSAPGRQAAALLSPSSFRPFMAPLTTLSKASSLAEADTKLFTSAKLAEGDPFRISNDEMKKAYTFSLKSVQPKNPPPSRRKSISKDDASNNHNTASTTKAGDSSMGSTSERTQKRRRSSKESESSSRKKKKPEPARNNEAASTGSAARTQTASQAPSAASRSRKKQPSTISPPKQGAAQIQPMQNAPKQNPSKHLPQSQQQTPSIKQQQLQNKQQSTQSTQKQQLSQQQQQQQRRQSQQQQQRSLQQQQQQLRQQQQQLRQQQQQLRQQQQRQQQQQQQQKNQQPQQNQQQVHLQPQQQNNQTQQQNQMQQQQQQQQNQSPQQQQFQQQPQLHQQQMAQFRMMHPSMAGRQVPGFPPTMQQMQQFYNPLNHPGQGQRVPFQPGLSPMQMQRPGMSMPFPGMNMPGQSPQQQSPNSTGGSNTGQQRPQSQQRDPKDQNDPLYMLK